MTTKHWRLEDGTVWPSVEAADGVVWRHHHSDPPDYDASGVAGAYMHLVAHPAGTEAAIRKLRMLRRKWRESQKVTP
ncbi:MAG: hypothetical protein GY772_27115 [bacterium]|nr:hypothetical protein [bacterium]